MKLTKNKLIKNTLIKSSLGLMILTGVAYAEDQSPFPISLNNSKNMKVDFSPKENQLSVLEWFNKGCPFVKKFYKEGFMQSLQEKYTKSNVTWFTINSTKENHSDFISKESRADLEKELKFKNTDTLYDEKGELGKKVGAKTTPHIFIYKGKELIYSGAVDDSPDSDTNPNDAKNNITSTLDATIKNEPVKTTKTRPYGCSIKYVD